MNARKTQNTNPAPRATKPERKTKAEPSDIIYDAKPVDLEQLRKKTAEAQTQRAHDLKRVTLSLRPAETGEVVAGHLLAQTRNEFRTQVFKLNDKKTQDLIENGASHGSSNGQGSATIKCTECGSRNISRRHRTSLERAALTLTEHKAYNCDDCQASFYARGFRHEGAMTDPGIFDLEPEPEV